MEEDDSPERIGDVAYGIFEIILNRELKRRGRYLFERVKDREDFLEDFKSIFLEFSREYKMLADALLEDFSGPGDIYSNIQNGEGVIPSKTTRMYWIVQDAPDFSQSPEDDEKGGKWLIFADKTNSDEIWEKIRDATIEKRLGISAKVSTAKQDKKEGDEKTVIYVNTRDWEDKEDVMRIRENLREMGIEQRIGYKRNLETFHGEYSDGGKKVTYYSA
ncbi:hypothetical protein J2128_001339 [Methanomicrobium sp. W14]|jgi:hypothetical protein|uniref:putative phosphothreonine lyase domain-containing protein n=1 Tax=Methanomicrobium sp. W14 TaxID=2817839 RepID=UPI001AEB1B15|nr:putative phosphothreonine lyase domain-containg protein [Methanomicrobium sp. W14]MBP2133385.1 hypothetical protein [Methanomicrobium sp. W14]